MHVHHREEESFYVLEGELTVRCGDDTFTAKAGTFVTIATRCAARIHRRQRHSGSHAESDDTRRR
jgi:mannose-6-phosphate isomerase-like protein (cupin superfamily)